MVQQPQQVQQQIIALPADPPQQPQPLELEIAVTQASGGTHPSASQAFAAPQGNLALLSREMLLLARFRDEGHKVTHAKARRWSWQCVSDLDRLRSDFLDVSHDHRFDWRCYVAFRTDAVAVIGNGIVKFEFRYFPNKIGNENFVTGDFVAHRLDGTCVHLHPLEPSFLGRDREAMPMYGRLEEWLPLAGVKAYGPKRDGEPAYVRMTESSMPCLNAYRPHISEDDPKGNLEARAFLQRQFEEWAADPCRGRFRRTVSQSEWNCIEYFINSCAAYAARRRCRDVWHCTDARDPCLAWSAVFYSSDCEWHPFPPHSCCAHGRLFQAGLGARRARLSADASRGGWGSHVRPV